MGATRTNSYVALVCLLCVALYLYTGYFVARTDSTVLLSCWSLLFAGYFFIVSKKYTRRVLFYLLVAALLFRFVLVLATPALSDDFYRFVWDGKLFAAGVNPYLYKPVDVWNSSIAGNAGLQGALFRQLNSPNYFTVYPSVLQFIFAAAVKISGGSIIGSVVVMRAFILAAEAGTMYLLYRLLQHLRLDENNVLLYALNPLVIIELTGNLHFEAVMIFLLVLAIYLLYRGRMFFAALAFSLSVCTKLLPLIFLPLVWQRLAGLQQRIFFIVVCLAAAGLTFIPFLDGGFIDHMTDSVGLYFQLFEFNASIYYIIREIGYRIAGYNIIAIAGKVLPLLSGLYILARSYAGGKQDDKGFMTTALWLTTVYYLLSLVVHPWYTSLLVVLSVFTTYRFPLVWSASIGFTYLTYRYVPYSEQLWVVAIEYVLVAGVMSFEWQKKRAQAAVAVQS